MAGTAVVTEIVVEEGSLGVVAGVAVAIVGVSADARD